MVENTSHRAVGSAPADKYAEVPASGLSKADLLCSYDREMMNEFSRLCLRHLNRHLSLRLFLSLLRNFVEANVEKEIEKNCLVIMHSSAEFERGINKTAVDLNMLFEMTKKVDHDFVSKLATPLFAMAIRHDDIEAVRKERIAALVDMVFDLLSNWKDSFTMYSVVKNTFSEHDYREKVEQVLRLYTLETKMLGNSITLHGPAGKAKDFLEGKLFATMETTASEVAAIFTGRVYADGVRG